MVRVFCALSLSRLKVRAKICSTSLRGKISLRYRSITSNWHHEGTGLRQASLSANDRQNVLIVAGICSVWLGNAILFSSTYRFDNVCGNHTDTRISRRSYLQRIRS